MNISKQQKKKKIVLSGLSQKPNKTILFYQKVTLDLKLEGFNWSTGDEGPYSA
jgi:sugar diacid utilization regulator